MNGFLVYDSYDDVFENMEKKGWPDYPIEFHFCYRLLELLVGNQMTDDEDGDGEKLSIMFLSEALKMETDPIPSLDYFRRHIAVNRKLFDSFKKRVYEHFDLLQDLIKMPRYKLLSVTRIDKDWVTLKFSGPSSKHKEMLSRPFPSFGLGPSGSTKKERAAFRREVVRVWQNDC